MKTNTIKFRVLLLLVISLLPYPVQAANGAPPSPNFGYGTHVDLWGLNPDAAIREAGRLNLDWVAIDLDWGSLQPEPSRPPTWARLDAATAQAAEHQIAVMLSITQAPDWAMTVDGPDPQKTAALALELAQRYATVLFALELYPEANTLRGWGVVPNPQAYYEMLRTSTDMLQGREILLVGAGLQPLRSEPEDMSDLAFLEALYAAGAKELMPIVGLRLPPLGNDPLTPNYETEELVIRHYENIRDLMVENGHQSGIIWVSGFSWDQNSLASQSQQAAWMKQAYLLFRSQLYIGAAFFDGLNPSEKGGATLLEAGQHHPAFDELIQLIAWDHNQQTIVITPELSKKTNKKNTRK